MQGRLGCPARLSRASRAPPPAGNWLSPFFEFGGLIGHSFFEGAGFDFTLRRSGTKASLSRLETTHNSPKKIQFPELNFVALRRAYCSRGAAADEPCAP